MVLSLEALSGIEDRALLSGHVLLLLDRSPDAAQECFLRSARPAAALEMRRDLRHWPQALTLARRLAPEAVPDIGRQHAAALEMAGEYAAAQEHYQEVSWQPGR
jgi:WD repeat-containing protein 19